MPTEIDDKKGGGIQSLFRASGLLDEIARNRDGIGLAHLSKATGLHTSTAFHLLKTLCILGYVRQDETTKVYRVGSSIFKLAATAFDEVEMARFAAPYLDELAMLTTETSHFAIRSGDQVVIVARTDGTGAFRINERTGVTRPAHATAVGKVLLSAMPRKTLDVLLSGRPLEPLTPRTITDPARLLTELESVRSSGIAYDDGEFHPELRCIAAGVHNFTGAIVGALGISTATWRLSLNDLAGKTLILRQIADKLSESLGYLETEAGARTGTL